jgi:hypothetical protein
LTKQHEYTFFNRFPNILTAAASCIRRFGFRVQIAFRMVFPIASAALCFIPGVEWT